MLQSIKLLILSFFLISSISFAASVTTGGGGASSVTSSLNSTVRILSSSQTISAGKIDTEDGGGLLSEDGGYILQDTAPSSPAENIFILTEDGGNLLNQDGTNILNELSTVLVTIAGEATPLKYASTLCQYAVVAAKSTNVGTIWLSGTDVAVGAGIPLIVDKDNVYVPIDDLNKVNIIGYAGDGVTFIYGSGVSDGDVMDDDSNLITDDGGNQITD